MVLEKRLDYGFIGYQVPRIPQAKRSARRGSIKRKVEDNPLHAFDLLATVAGKLLLEGGNSIGVTVTSEDQGANIQDGVLAEYEKDISDLPRVDCPDNEKKKSNFLVKDPVLFADTLNGTSAEPDAACPVGSALTTYVHLSKVSSYQKTVQNNDENELGSLPRKVEGSLVDMESSLCESEYRLKEKEQCVPLNNGQVPFQVWPDLCSPEDPMFLDGKPTALICSTSSGKVSFHEDHRHCGSPSLCRDNVTVVSRDDDENSSGCSQRSTTMKPTRKPECIAERRIKKFLASKFSLVAPKVKDGDLSDYGGNSPSVYHNRKSILKRQRSQRIYPPKKRRIFNYSSGSSCEGITDFKRTSESPYEAADIAASCFGPKRHGDSGSSSSVVDQKASPRAREPHVKLRIKSFRVPELLIEIPETETVASLKRTVMEAAYTLLGDGLRVGILFQGKKIVDDNKTLLQTGISHDNRLDALAFTLEPNTPQDVVPVTSGAHPLLSSSAPQPLTKCLPATSAVNQDASLPSTDITLSNLNLGPAIESDHDSAPSPAEVAEKSSFNSRALVPIPEANVKPLTIVPMNKKSKDAEIGRRRIRRPFSVSEVEALVEAVEQLGTGRWRDVKLRAFENVKHRTYVDLKDKWKTLVHTARISPQQRRGEPVPQELLDRVLTAHAYWLQHQTKQQPLKQPAEACRLLL